ncbi:unnamed protein product [Caenorhabditis brenneri]
MLIAVLIAILLLIPVTANGEEHVKKTVTRIVSSSDSLYRRFIRTVYSRNLNKFDFRNDGDGTYYVLRPNEPLEFEKYKYYWNESHRDLKEYNSICEYQVHYFIDAEELKNTYFPDGTRLKSMFFHCSFPYSCVAMECLIESRFYLAIIFVGFVFFGLYFVRRCVMKEIKQLEKIRDQCVRPQSVPGPRYMSPMFLQNEVEEPPPPSYNMVIDTAPPSYESVVRDRVTYTLPSYSSVA